MLKTTPMDLAQQNFAKNLALGMAKLAAARTACLPANRIKETMEDPQFQALVMREQEQVNKQLILTRNDVLQGLLDAIEDAKLQGEAMPQIAGWREIGKVIGAYAPEERKISYSGDVTVIQKRIQELADEKLHEYALIEGEVVSEDQSVTTFEESNHQDQDQLGRTESVDAPQEPEEAA